MDEDVNAAEIAVQIAKDYEKLRILSMLKEKGEAATISYLEEETKSK